MTTRLFLKTDGTVVVHEHALSMTAIRELVAPNTKTLDTVNVRRGLRLVGFGKSFEIPAGHVMIVDDTGLIDGRPLNTLASQIYRAQCRPEYQDQAQICGDAFVCPDSDFE